MENVKDLTSWSKEVHQANVDKGFYEKPKEFGTLLMLITSELAEALEADRHSMTADLNHFNELIDDGHDFVKVFKETVKDSIEDEMADALIRILDTCGYMKIDLQKHVELKLRYNATRAQRHGKKY